MPLYEYRCQECGALSEFLLLAREEEAKLGCKSCGSKQLTRVLSTSVGLRASRPAGQTCCGRQERCETPRCSTGEPCRHP